MGGDATNPLLEPTQLQISPNGHRRPAVRRCQLHHLFPPGTGVEVQTNEEDFKGVYFSATVLKQPNSPKKSGRKKSRKLYVEYQNLLAHEDGSDRLREYVDVAFVRPAPLVQEIVKGFEPDDAVDAFYKDGWWTGVVTRVVAGGDRFVVTFSNPPDELEFGLNELRAHWDWVNGAWVRPQRQSIAGLMFDVGRKVEVSFVREDSQEAWFPATVLEDLGDGRFSVESSHVKADNNTLAKATVDSLHIRPCPPLLKDKNFVLLEKVDAFFQFGWWNGIITKHLENSRYVVFFKQLKYDKEFTQSELRPHMDWKDGKWFTSSQEPSTSSVDDRACQHHLPVNPSASLATAPVTNPVNGGDTCFGKTHSSLFSTNDQFEHNVLGNQESSHATTSLTKKRGHLSDSGGALSQPLKKLREEETVGANPHDGANAEFFSLGGLESPESLKNVETSVPQTTTDQSSSNHPWEKNVQRKQRNIRKSSCENNKSTSNFPRKSTAEVLLDLDFDEKEPETEEGAQHKHAICETELPVVIGLPCPEPGSSGIPGSNRGRPSDKKVHIDVDDQRQQISDFTSQTIKDVKQSGIREVSEKRKRGRPKKILLESIETLSIGNLERGSHSSGNSERGSHSSGDLNKKDDDSQRHHEVETIGMEASTSNQDQTMPNQDKVMLNKEKKVLNQEKMPPSQEKMPPSQEKKEMVQNHEKTVPNLEQMSQNQENAILDPKKTPYQEKTVLNQKRTAPYQEMATPNQRKTMSYQEKIAHIQKMTVSNPKKTAPNQEKVAQNQEKAVQNQKRTALVSEKTLSDQEKTMSNQEKTMLDHEKTTAKQKNIANGQSGPKKRKVRMTKGILAGNRGKTGVAESVRPVENISPKGVRKEIPNGRIAVKVREFQGASGGKVTLINHSVHEEKVKEPSNEFDNEPLSKWIEEIHSSSAIDGSRLLPEDPAVQYIVNEASEKRPESERQSSNLVDKGDIAPTEPQRLPSENSSANIVLGEGTEKQSEGGTEIPLSVDKVSIVGRDPQSLANVEETALVLLDQNSEKQSQNKARDTAVVDKSLMVLSQPQSSLKGTVDAVLSKDIEKRPENGTTVDNVSTVASEPENLPFVKNTVLWKTIESMDVFQRLPQKPHFLPLLNFKESSREGLAIGYMVTFSSLVERASKLQLNDPVTIMEDIKETLTDLDKHGFTVGPIKQSIDDLLAKKDEVEKLANDVQTLQSKIKESSEVKTRKDREVEEIKGYIENLQKRLSEAESTKARVDEEMAFLQVGLREKEDRMKNLENGFKGTVSSIL